MSDDFPKNAQWFDRDLPVLKAAHALLEETGSPVVSDKIAASTGISKPEVVKSLAVLQHDYLECHESGTLNAKDFFALGVTSAGLRAVGAWPSESDYGERLLATLDRLIDETPEGSPKSNRLKALRGAAGDIGKEVLGSVIASAAMLGLGLGS